MGAKMVLFGGTFDPVHHGHLIIARHIAEQLGIARITFVPTSQPPHKPAALAGPADRLAMLELAIEGQPMFEVCDLELGRPGPSYTLQTIQDLRDQHGRDLAISLIIGADMLQELPHWHQVSKLIDSVKFIIAARPPLDQQMPQILAEVGSQLGDQVAQSLSESIVKTPLLEISSTDIRSRVSRGMPIDYLVPVSVATYIAKMGFYRT